MFPVWLTRLPAISMPPAQCHGTGYTTSMEDAQDSSTHSSDTGTSDWEGKPWDASYICWLEQACLLNAEITNGGLKCVYTTNLLI